MTAVLLCLAAVTVVHPVDDGRALVNPDMGLMAYCYSNKPWNYSEFLKGPGDTCQDFPGCSAVYMRLPWSIIEPQDGVFNWQALDTPAQRWIERGAQIAIRITATESWMRHATPEWVKNAGAAGIEFEMPRRDSEYRDARPLWEPDYGDPVFLEKLEGLVRALASRYDGNPHVAFIDIGTYGLWGEGHTVHTSKAGPKKAFADMKLQIDMYRRYFRRTRLVLSDDVDGPQNKTGNCPILDYARSVGVAWRDDSILCLPPPNHWHHADQAERYWRTLPVVLETQHFWPSYFIQKAWTEDLLVRSVEEHHASWLSIHGDPWLILKHSSNAVARINRRIGYRFQLHELSYPSRVKVVSGKRGDGGEPLRVKWKWANAGVAPCYRDLFPCLTVKDGAGNPLAVLVDGKMNLRRLPVAPPGKAVAYPHAAEFTPGVWYAPAVPAGEFDVFVSVGDPDGTPVIELPLPAGDGRRRYRVGRIVFEQ